MNHPQRVDAICELFRGLACAASGVFNLMALRMVHQADSCSADCERSAGNVRRSYCSGLRILPVLFFNLLAALGALLPPGKTDAVMGLIESITGGMTALQRMRVAGALPEGLPSAACH